MLRLPSAGRFDDHNCIHPNCHFAINIVHLVNFVLYSSCLRVCAHCKVWRIGPWGHSRRKALAKTQGLGRSGMKLEDLVPESDTLPHALWLAAAAMSTDAGCNV